MKASTYRKHIFSNPTFNTLFQVLLYTLMVPEFQDDVPTTFYVNNLNAIIKEKYPQGKFSILEDVDGCTLQIHIKEELIWQVTIESTIIGEDKWAQ